MAKKQQQQMGFPASLPYEEEPEVKDEKDKALEDLNKKLADLDAAMKAKDAQISSLQTAQLSWMASPVVASTKTEGPKAPVFDTDGMPDPTVDPDGYAKELQKRINAHTAAVMQYNQQASRAAAAEETKYNGIWNQFSEKYEAYAADVEKAQIAATNVVNKAKAAGKDIDRYMLGTSDQFMQDVVSEMDRLFDIKGKLAAESGSDEDADEGNEAVNAALGIFGGVQSGGKVSGASQKAQDGGLAGTLRDFQMKHGLHR